MKVSKRCNRQGGENNTALLRDHKSLGLNTSKNLNKQAQTTPVDLCWVQPGYKEKKTPGSYLNENGLADENGVMSRLHYNGYGECHGGRINTGQGGESC